MWRHLAGVFGTNVLAKLASVVALVGIVRTLSEGDFARYTVAYTVYGMLSGFVFIALNFGMVRAAARYRHDTGGRAFAAFASYGALQLIAFGACLIVAVVLQNPLAQWTFGTTAYAPELLVGLCCCSSIILSNYVLYIAQADEAFGVYNRINLARHLLLLPSLGIFWITGTLNWLTVMLGFAAANALPPLVYLLLPANRRILTLADLDTRLMRTALSATAWMMLYFTINGAVDYAGNALLARTGDTAALAQYGAALRYYHVVIITLFSLNAVLLPRFAKADADTHSFRSFLLRWWGILVWGYVPLGLVLYLAEPLWVWVNGEAYRSAYHLFAWMSLGAWAYLLLLPSLNMLIARERYGLLTLCAAFSLSAYVTIGTLIASEYKADGMAILSALGLPLTPLLMTVLVWFQPDLPTSDPLEQTTLHASLSEDS
jgi:O-antigen/teichoic acid export membrane protein